MTWARSPPCPNNRRHLAQSFRIGEAEGVVDQDRDRVLFGDACGAAIRARLPSCPCPPDSDSVGRCNHQGAIEDAQVPLSTSPSKSLPEHTDGPCSLQPRPVRRRLTSRGVACPVITSEHCTARAREPTRAGSRGLCSRLDLGGVATCPCGLRAEYRRSCARSLVQVRAISSSARAIRGRLTAPPISARPPRARSAAHCSRARRPGRRVAGRHGVSVPGRGKFGPYGDGARCGSAGQRPTASSAR